ncbi:MAG TPA: LuxR C-terminal-related transcriptional regulator [Sedimentisphaerales bacterium]|nr:LuxR C-terminal-related transcriptional regulator [Sedimentisphaerales bacterium]
MTGMPNSQAEDFISNEPGVKPPDVALSKKQWLYVQNRYNLTPRERQIAELICQGLRNGGIAKVLRIRPGTVKTHTRNIYRKTRVESKIAMLLRFLSDAKDLSFTFDSAPQSPRPID